MLGLKGKEWAMKETTVSVTLHGPEFEPTREALETLVELLENALDDRTDNGTVGVTFSTGEIEIEVIVANEDIDLGFHIGRRIILDSMADAGITINAHTEQAQWQVRQDLVPA
jgi:hypothetical protein